ncbi:hypothetical protein EJ110_NYTH17646 [Nymphaea thermarum]|nr:hypothetical protein EJ110_NYTH17646 [Nymphaea thermarum]
MGNYFSCISVVNSQVVTIADLDGNILEFRSPRPVAELMIEFPGRIVAPADGLQSHRRVQTMRADDETRIGHFYVLFPMDRMNSRVSDEEISVLAASCLAGKKTSGARVFPEAAGEKISAVAPKLRLEELSSPAAGLATARMPNQRRWRPELQSINELQCTA